MDCRVGKLGKEARGWKGSDAGYAAIHMWLTKHYKKESCDHCDKKLQELSRLEWANISGKYKREREDYLCLCPSCHRKMDLNSDSCVNNHLRNGNTRVNIRGHKVCMICARENNRRLRERKRANN